MTILTDDRLNALEAPAKGRRIVFDAHKSAPRGFGVRITAKGVRAFVLRYTSSAGKDRLLTIGEYGENKWTLAAARKEAGRLRRQIDGGTDILEQRRAERAEWTVADAARKFLTAKAALSSHRDIDGLFRNYLLPAIGKKKLTTVRRREVIDLLEELAAQHPRQAGKLLTYTKQLFAWCEDRELVTVSPVGTLKPKGIAEGLIARNRARVLDDEEIRAFWNNVDTCGIHKVTALALKMVLVTGQRPGEVAGMRWDELQGKVWTIPESRRGKTNDPHTVPLTATAETILGSVRTELKRLAKRRRNEPAGYVFEARAGEPVTTAAMSRAVIRYAAKLGVKDTETWGRWTPHDLRRTMRTGLAAARVSEVVAERTIGHVKQGIIKTYDLHAYDDEKRVALQAWERRLLRIVEGKPAGDNVVSMGAQR